ncbi:MAG TPA: prepilin peptidase [Planctomycetes bacterium]|nr:prepilin peptidase [Planctomycetota bacterium]
MDLSPTQWITFFALLGLVVGSFLNVCIYRLPTEGVSVSNPKRSRCPNCGRELTWRDNIPVLSWLILRGRCRSCSWSIPWRYPLVELLTAVLFGLAAWRATAGHEGGPAIAVAFVHAVVLAGLVVATFVDFDHFEIPDEVSIGGMLLAPIASFLVPTLHANTALAHTLSSGDVDRAGALLASLAGMAVGGGVLLAIGALGSRAFGRDAMGFGDVKLLAAGGGFIGPGGALAALLIGALAASVAGIVNIARFYLLVRRRAAERGAVKRRGSSLRVARIAGRYLPFGPYLGIGIGIVLLDWDHVIEVWRGLSL